MGHQADITANFTGATLIYGPEAPRPDLILAGQFLIDDLRRAGLRPGALRINSRSLRVRMEGLDLALAITGGPLPPEALMDLTRPVLPEMAGPRGPFNDITHLRVQTALRRHALALGVLLRRRNRGAGGAESSLGDDEEEDFALTTPGRPSARPLRTAETGRSGLPGMTTGDALWATLHPAILAISEAAPPGLVIWQPTGVVYNAAEFGSATMERLAEQGDPAVMLRPLAIRRPSNRVRELVMPRTLSRDDRAASRSAGRLFQPAAEPEAPSRRAAAPLAPLPGEQKAMLTALREPQGAVLARHGRMVALGVAAGFGLGLLVWMALGGSRADDATAQASQDPAAQTAPAAGSHSAEDEGVDPASGIDSTASPNAIAAEPRAQEG